MTRVSATCRLLVLEHHTEVAFAARDDHFVSRQRAVQRIFVRNKGAHVELALRHELDHRGHVAIFGPADISRRIVIALIFVAAIVASGAVGARHEQRQLLFVVELARHVHADLAHDHDAGAITGQLCGEVKRFA